MAEGYLFMGRDEWKPPQEYHHGKLKVRFSFKYATTENYDTTIYGTFTDEQENHSLGVISRDNPGRNEFKCFKWDLGPINTPSELQAARAAMKRAETYGQDWFFIICSATLTYDITEIGTAVREFESDSDIEHIRSVQADLLDDLLHPQDAQDLLETLREKVAHVEAYLHLLKNDSLSKQLKSVVTYELLGLNVGA